MIHLHVCAWTVPHQVLPLCDAVVADVQHLQEGEEASQVLHTGDAIPGEVQLAERSHTRQALEGLQVGALHGQDLEREERVTG